MYVRWQVGPISLSLWLPIDKFPELIHIMYKLYAIDFCLKISHLLGRGRGRGKRKNKPYAPTCLWIPQYQEVQCDMEFPS